MQEQLRAEQDSDIDAPGTRTLGRVWEGGCEVIGRGGVLPDAVGRQDPLHLGVSFQDERRSV